MRSLTLCLLALSAASVACKSSLHSPSLIVTPRSGERHRNGRLEVPILSAATGTSVNQQEKINGISTIVGGSLAHLAFGTLYCWGNFLSYAPDQLRFFDGKTHAGLPPDALTILPATLVSQCITMPLGPLVCKRLGSRMTTLLGGLLMAAGVFLSSYARTLSSFMTFYSLMFGIGVGLAYTAPMSAGWAWLPKSKGLVSGIILCLYGAGGFIFNLVGTKLVNSEGFNLVDGRFPDIVYDRFYGMIRKLALIYGALVVTGAFLIKDPPKAPAVSSSGQKKSLHGYLNKKHRNVATSQNSNGVGPMAAMKTKQFWLLWLMCLTSTSAGLNVASVYKQFASGKSALSGDGYQAITGALGALFNAVGRLAWGLVIDKVGCKNSFLALSAGQALLYLFFTRLTSSKLSFTAVICACYFLLAGNFALAPPAIQRLFGPEHGTLIYGLVYSAFGLAAIGGSMITKQLMANFGWDGVFKVLAALSLFATFVTSMLSPISFYPGSSV